MYACMCVRMHVCMYVRIRTSQGTSGFDSREREPEKLLTRIAGCMCCVYIYVHDAHDDDADDDDDDDAHDAHDAHDDDDAPTFLRALPSHPALAARRTPRRPASRAPRREVLFGRPGVAPGACPRGRCVAAEGRGGRKRNRIM